MDMARDQMFYEIERYEDPQPTEPEEPETDDTPEPEDDGPEYNGMQATYSPEDNKLRLYASGRLDSETYGKVKAAGFKWAPKQELFVAPAWTPAREDLLLELCGEIGDEDYSPEERSADRAERFAGYRDKRASEAGGLADRFESGPSAFGGVDGRRVYRLARRADRCRGRACSQWEKAEYWQTRTRAVISHAMHKSDARTRRGRILTLEAEQRKHEASREEYAIRFKLWSKVSGLEGADSAPVTADGFLDREQSTPAALAAYALANAASCWGDYKHPRTGRESSLYGHLTDPADPITAREAAALWLEGKPAPDSPDTYDARWSAHYARRLEYERAMLAEEGGTAAAVEMVPGGFIGRHQIQKVNKSPATGRVVSVGVIGEHDWKRNADGSPLVCARVLNVERLPENAYRPPTPEELAAFQAAQKQAKAEAKASKPAAPSLINPTDESAEALQAILNAAGARTHGAKADRWSAAFQPAAVVRMSQAKYSEVSKGTYSAAETRTLHACGRLSLPYSDMWSEARERYTASLGPALCKVRVYTKTGGGWHTPPAVVVLTDKPQKPLPLDQITTETPGESQQELNKVRA